MIGTLPDPADLFASNREAMTLLSEVQRFFASRLSIEWLPDGEQVSNFELDPTTSPMAPKINLAPTPRARSALMHELLHLALRMWGYPYLVTDEAAGLTELGKQVVSTELKELRNALDHEAFLPNYLALGFPIGEFLSPGGHETDVKNVSFALTLPDAEARTRRIILSTAYFRIESAAQQGNEMAADILSSIVAGCEDGIDDFAHIVSQIEEWRRVGLTNSAATFQEATTQLLSIISMPAPNVFASLHTAIVGGLNSHRRE